MFDTHRKVWSLLLFLGILSISIAGHSQNTVFDDVRFDPPDPQPGTSLKLSVWLLPAQETGREISIRLITCDGESNSTSINIPPAAPCQPEKMQGCSILRGAHLPGWPPREKVTQSCPGGGHFGKWPPF